MNSHNAADDNEIAHIAVKRALRGLAVAPCAAVALNVLLGAVIAMAGAPWQGLALALIGLAYGVCSRPAARRMLAALERDRAPRAEAWMAAWYVVWGVASQAMIVVALAQHPSPGLMAVACLSAAGIIAVALPQNSLRVRLFLAHALGPAMLLAACAVIAFRVWPFWDAVALAGGIGVLGITAFFALSGASVGQRQILTLQAKQSALIFDLTAANQAESRTLAALSLAIDAAKAGAWDIDLKRGEVTTTPHLQKIFGRSFDWEAFKSGGGFLFVHPQDKQLVEDHFIALRRSACQRHCQHRIVQPNGAVRWVSTAAQSLADDAGQVTRITLLTQDITERKTLEASLVQAMAMAQASLEDKGALLRAITEETDGEVFSAADPAAPPIEGCDLSALQQRLTGILEEIDKRDLALGRAVEALRRARGQADAANAAKSQFLANMSHELRTPLNAVIGYAEIVAEDLAEGRTDNALCDLARIRAAGRHLLSLIAEMLDMAKIESGRLDVSMEAIDAVGVAVGVLDSVAPQALKGGTRCVLEAPASIPKLTTDALRLRQCLLNLASNAVKFTQDGVVTLRVEPAVRDEAPAIAFVVRDTGIGIAPQDIDRLFQPFEQLDGSASRQFGGAGLGLAITQRLARLLGGDVTVTSEPGAGAAFTLTLPCQPLAPAASTSIAA